MITTPSRILYQLLRDAGLVAAPGTGTSSVWVGFVGLIPADQKPALGFLDAGGRQEGRIQQTGEVNRMWRVQIMIRSMDYPKGGEYCGKLEIFLRKVGIPPERGGLGWKKVTVGSESFIIPGIHPETLPMFLSKNPEDNTQLWVMNELFKLQAA